LLQFAVWDETNEGRSFWVLVRDSVDAGICLPPLPADPPESPVVTTPETTHDDLAERIAIAIAPTVIRYWADDQRGRPAEIAKLAKAIAGELRK
jgi:hypothetical protein